MREATGRPIVVGAGIAGLMTALELAPEPVLVLSRAPLGMGSASTWAQGGLSAALGADDNASLHAADTLAAGDGLSDPRVVGRITSEGARAVEALVRHGVVFDRDASGGFARGLEAAHGRRRIVHAKGDGTGRTIMCALIDAVRRTASIEVLEGVEARQLVVVDGCVAGLVAVGPSGEILRFPATRVVIATGGIGGLYRETTNPLNAVGHGLALAARAGAVLADMEFVQFHPTALAVGLDPMPLVSEAVRGDGAILVNERGERFMAGYARAELEPRDVVARAVWLELHKGRGVFLDVRKELGARFGERFPGIAASCRAAGIDPVREPIPVRPAAHYHMGGIEVDAGGRSSVGGLWACGEAAATGLHGANRLASNSLLEACVCAFAVAESVAGTPEQGSDAHWPQRLPDAPRVDELRPIMANRLGVVRDRESLLGAARHFAGLAFEMGPAADPALVALFIGVAALRRKESRGAHYRSDFPARSTEVAYRQRLRIAELQAWSEHALEAPVPQLGGV
ncbi:MAG TPA: L-aspartate oxidase [Candidatus Binataceae bacterium]|nr:L-aspartate oxidase [Candidatus Binataceae bacterium]